MDLFVLFIWLLFAHYIFDFGLQSSWMAENKYKLHHIMLSHCMIYTAGIALVLECFGVFNLYIIAGILITHFGIDTLKGKAIEVDPDKIVLLFHMDQIMHILILVLVTCLLA